MLKAPLCLKWPDTQRKILARVIEQKKEQESTGVLEAGKKPLIPFFLYLGT